LEPPLHQREVEDLARGLGLPDAVALHDALVALDLPGVLALETSEGPVALFDRGRFALGDRRYRLGSRRLGEQAVLLFRCDADDGTGELVTDTLELFAVEAHPAYAKAALDAWVDEEDARRAVELLAAAQRDLVTIEGKAGPVTARVQERFTLDGQTYLLVVPLAGGAGHVYRESAGGLTPVKERHVLAHARRLLDQGPG
jgi:hypothetical protein